MPRPILAVRLDTNRRQLMLILLSLGLVACADDSVEWIEVPLAENVFYADSVAVNSDAVEIPLFANSDLEYMLNMERGQSVAYRWEAADLTDPEKLLAEFHGHTIRTSEEPGDVMFYQQGRSDVASGYLVAPFDGVHGWYFSNETSNDITVQLSLSGFYEKP